MFGINTFWIPCLLMGAGIAVDVAIATIARFKDDDLSLINWTLPITATHIALPAFGYYGFWLLSEYAPAWQMWLGIIGFVFVLLFVYEVFCEAIDTKPIQVLALSDNMTKLFSATKHGAGRFITVMAVSWDALWSGPAKSAQAANQHWSNDEVFWSFFVAGLAVAVIAQVALAVALWLRKRKFHNAHRLAIFNIVGTYAELSVIGGFGLLSLYQGLDLPSVIYQTILTTAIILSPIFVFFYLRLYETETKEAMEAIEG